MDVLVDPDFLPTTRGVLVRNLNFESICLLIDDVAQKFLLEIAVRVAG